MSLSERSLLDAELMAIEEINLAGGILSRRIEPVIKDGESTPEVFSARANEFFDSGIDTLFGAWTSASRKAIKPIVESRFGLLFFPVQYEGLEESPSIIYTGSCLNQQINTSVLWSLEHFGKFFFLLGSDYVFPRAANRLICSVVRENNGHISGERYFNLGTQDFREVIQQIKELKPSVIFNTLNGDSNVGFFRQAGEAGLLPSSFPVMSVSLTETEVQVIGESTRGHYACWGYFQSLKNDENARFIRNIKQRYGEDKVCTAPMVMAYSQIYLWKQAAEMAGTFEPLKVTEKLPGCSFLSPAGQISIGSNHHIAKSIRIGKVNEFGQFDVLWESKTAINPQPWLGLEDVDFPRKSLVKQCMASFPDLLFQNSLLEQQINKSFILEGELKQLNANLENIIEQRTRQLCEMVDELRIAKGKAEEGDKLKTSLLMNMSHELRTPINGILGFGDILRDQLKDPEQKKMASHISNLGQKLLVTFTSMLQLSILEAEKSQPDYQVCNLGNLAREEIIKFKQHAALKKITIKEDIDANIQFRTDTNMFSDILFFLLDNALKFTEAGYIWVNIHQAIENNTRKITISIRDTGIGIKDEQMKYIFDAFRQGSEGIGRSHSGNGMGLTLCKRFITLLGGQISVETTVGTGSTFTVSFSTPEEINIPANPESLDKAPVLNVDANTNISIPAKNKLHLLVVEDNPANAELVVMYLKMHYHIDVAFNGKLAVKYAWQNKYDLILMDINLGGAMDGIQATREIRSLENYEDVPVIAVTGYSTDAEKQQILDKGLTDFLSKPFSKEELLNMIEKWIKKNK